MEIYTSYFYQIRFFKPNMIPLSTARFQPKWYGTKPYVDKNGVMNGLCARPFVLPEYYWNLLVEKSTECKKECNQKDLVPNCGFMNIYREYLNTLDFNNIYSRCEKMADRIQKKIGFTEEPEIILIVHEAKSCNCAERPIIQEWFKNNGYPITEWERGNNND